MKTIGIFPAAGALGGSTYTHLLKLVPNDKVVLIARYPEKIPERHVKAGVRLRQASYESSPEELEAAFADIDTLLLISYPSHVHEYRVKVRLPAVDAARRAGISHIFYCSLAFAGDSGGRSSRAVVMQAHLDTEARLRELARTDAGFTFTAVREGLYAESTPIYTAFFNPREARGSGSGSGSGSGTGAVKILIPHDGGGLGVAWAKRDELGEATARLIAGYATADGSGRPYPHVNGTVVLTGPRVWTLAETLEVLGKVSGTKLQVCNVSVDEYAAQPQVLARFGTEEKALTWATAWDAIRAGETSVVSPQLGEILGRQPTAFDVAVEEFWA